MPERTANSVENPYSGHRNIFLVGLMGAGKTSAGRMLAKRTGKQFYDSDAEIEAATGVSIPVIFDIEGEAVTYLSAGAVQGQVLLAPTKPVTLQSLRFGFVAKP